MSTREKAVIYLRVSTKQQASDDRDGYDRQKALLTEYANRNGLEIVAEFKDAISGGSDGEEREGWTDLIDYMRSDGVKIILIEKLDRLARDIMVQESIITSLQQDGFTLKSLSDPDLCSSDPTRVLMRQILGVFAQYERALIKSRTHRKGAANAPGTKPYGALPGEQECLDRMRALRAEGKSFLQIAAQLNAEGFRPRGRTRMGQKQGTLWGETMVAKLLRRV